MCSILHGPEVSQDMDIECTVWCRPHGISTASAGGGLRGASHNDDPAAYAFSHL
jgi:hypothetical protein